MSLRSVAPVAFALAACGGGDGVSREECDAVLAHLIVLESTGGESWGGPMCKYHESCDGSEAPRWAAACPRTVTRAEVRCIERATSLVAADGCVLRSELDARIQGARGGGAFPGRTTAPDPGDSALAELVALRDAACGCHDTACAATMLDRYADQARRYSDIDDKHLRERAMTLIEAAAKCLVAADNPPDAGPVAAPTPIAPTGLPHCDQYVAALEAYAACSAIPEDARQSIRDTVDYVKKSWADLASMPDSVRAATDDSCAQSIDGIKQALVSLGCAVP